LRRGKFKFTELAGLTAWQVGAQPFDPAPRDLRMNRAAARFTSSAPALKARVELRSTGRSVAGEPVARLGDADSGEASLAL